jgi:hypothetical protein
MVVDMDGVGITPPKVLGTPKPESSVTISSTPPARRRRRAAVRGDDTMRVGDRGSEWGVTIADPTREVHVVEPTASFADLVAAQRAAFAAETGDRRSPRSCPALALGAR